MNTNELKELSEKIVEEGKAFKKESLRLLRRRMPVFGK